MRPTDGTRDGAAPQLAVRPRIVTAADETDVMREQLEYLIEHAGESRCGCEICLRYLRARALLLEIFRVRKAVPIASGPVLQLTP